MITTKRNLRFVEERDIEQTIEQRKREMRAEKLTLEHIFDADLDIVFLTKRNQ